MQSAHPELGDQAFGNVADALVTVEYESHRDACDLRVSAVHRRAQWCKLSNGRPGNLLKHKTSGEPTRSENPRVGGSIDSNRLWPILTLRAAALS